MIKPRKPEAAWNTGCAPGDLIISEEEQVALIQIPGWALSSSVTISRSSDVTEEVSPATAIQVTEPTVSNNCILRKPSHLISKCGTSGGDLGDLSGGKSVQTNIREKKALAKDNSSVLKRSNSFPFITKFEPMNLLQPCRSEESLKISRCIMSDKACNATNFKKPTAEKDKLLSERDQEDQKGERRNIERLDDKILNHKYFKEVDLSSKNINTAPFLLPNKSVGNTLELTKRFELLEKRFSPLKEFAEKTPTQLQGPFLCNSSDVPWKLMPLSCSENNPISMASSSGLATKASSIDAKNLPDSIENMDPILKNSAIFNESFVSQPIPSAQPPFEIVSPPLKDGEAELSKFEVVGAAKNASPTDQEDSGSINNEISPATAKVNGKRKRKMKPEGSSKKFREINIEFTAEQIHQMVDLMKVLHTAI